MCYLRSVSLFTDSWQLTGHVPGQPYGQHPVPSQRPAPRDGSTVNASTIMDLTDSPPRNRCAAGTPFLHCSTFFLFFSTFFQLFYFFIFYYCFCSLFFSSFFLQCSFFLKLFCINSRCPEIYIFFKMKLIILHSTYFF